MLQYVAVCCSVLHRGAEKCMHENLSSVVQCVAKCCSVLRRAAVCRSVSQCVAVCCSVLQCVAVCCSMLLSLLTDHRDRVRHDGSPPKCTDAR